MCNVPLDCNSRRYITPQCICDTQGIHFIYRRKYIAIYNLSSLKNKWIKRPAYSDRNKKQENAIIT
jgi:hypothetical protein